GESRIRERSIRGERSNPAALADACASLSDYSLRWIIRLASGAVIHGPNHSRDHALPDLGGDRQLAFHFHAHLVRFFSAVGDLRNEQLATIGHCRNKRSE